MTRPRAAPTAKAPNRKKRGNRKGAYRGGIKKQVVVVLKKDLHMVMVLKKVITVISSFMNNQLE